MPLYGPLSNFYRKDGHGPVAVAKNIRWGAQQALVFANKVTYFGASGCIPLRGMQSCGNIRYRNNEML